MSKSIKTDCILCISSMPSIIQKFKERNRMKMRERRHRLFLQFQSNQLSLSSHRRHSLSNCESQETSLNPTLNKGKMSNRKEKNLTTNNNDNNFEEDSNKELTEKSSNKSEEIVSNDQDSADFSKNEHEEALFPSSSESEASSSFEGFQNKGKGSKINQCISHVKTNKLKEEKKCISEEVAGLIVKTKADEKIQYSPKDNNELEEKMKNNSETEKITEDCSENNEKSKDTRISSESTEIANQFGGEDESNLTANEHVKTKKYAELSMEKNICLEERADLQLNKEGDTRYEQNFGKISDINAFSANYFNEADKNINLAKQLLQGLETPKVNRNYDKDEEDSLNLNIKTTYAALVTSEKTDCGEKEIDILKSVDPMVQVNSDTKTDSDENHSSSASNLKKYCDNVKENINLLKDDVTVMGKYDVNLREENVIESLKQLNTNSVCKLNVNINSAEEKKVDEQLIEEGNINLNDKNFDVLEKMDTHLMENNAANLNEKVNITYENWGSFGTQNVKNGNENNRENSSGEINEKDKNIENQQIQDRIKEGDESFKNKQVQVKLDKSGESLKNQAEVIINKNIENSKYPQSLEKINEDNENLQSQQTEVKNNENDESLKNQLEDKINGNNESLKNQVQVEGEIGGKDDVLNSLLKSKDKYDKHANFLNSPQQNDDKVNTEDININNLKTEEKTLENNYSQKFIEKKDLKNDNNDPKNQGKDNVKSERRKYPILPKVTRSKSKSMTRSKTKSVTKQKEKTSERKLQTKQKVIDRKQKTAKVRVKKSAKFSESEENPNKISIHLKRNKLNFEIKGRHPDGTSPAAFGRRIQRRSMIELYRQICFDYPTKDKRFPPFLRIIKMARTSIRYWEAKTNLVNEQKKMLLKMQCDTLKKRDRYLTDIPEKFRHRLNIRSSQLPSVEECQLKLARLEDSVDFIGFSSTKIPHASSFNLDELFGSPSPPKTSKKCKPRIKSQNQEKKSYIESPSIRKSYVTLTSLKDLSHRKLDKFDKHINDSTVCVNMQSKALREVSLSPEVQNSKVKIVDSPERRNTIVSPSPEKQNPRIKNVDSPERRNKIDSLSPENHNLRIKSMDSPSRDKIVNDAPCPYIKIGSKSSILDEVENMKKSVKNKSEEITVNSAVNNRNLYNNDLHLKKNEPTFDNSFSASRKAADSDNEMDWEADGDYASGVKLSKRENDMCRKSLREKEVKNYRQLNGQKFKKYEKNMGKVGKKLEKVSNNFGKNAKVGKVYKSYKAKAKKWSALKNFRKRSLLSRQLLKNKNLYKSKKPEIIEIDAEPPDNKNTPDIKPVEIKKYDTFKGTKTSKKLKSSDSNVQKLKSPNSNVQKLKSPDSNVKHVQNDVTETPNHKIFRRNSSTELLANSENFLLEDFCGFDARYKDFITRSKIGKLKIQAMKNDATASLLIHDGNAFSIKDIFEGKYDYEDTSNPDHPDYNCTSEAGEQSSSGGSRETSSDESKYVSYRKRVEGDFSSSNIRCSYYKLPKSDLSSVPSNFSGFSPTFDSGLEKSRKFNLLPENLSEQSMLDNSIKNAKIETEKTESSSSTLYLPVHPFISYDYPVYFVPVNKEYLPENMPVFKREGDNSNYPIYPTFVKIDRTNAEAVSIPRVAYNKSTELKTVNLPVQNSPADVVMSKILPPLTNSPKKVEIPLPKKLDKSSENNLQSIMLTPGKSKETNSQTTTCSYTPELQRLSEKPCTDNLENSQSEKFSSSISNNYNPGYKFVQKTEKCDSDSDNLNKPNRVRFSPELLSPQQDYSKMFKLSYGQELFCKPSCSLGSSSSNISKASRKIKKCSKCDFETEKLGVLKRHELQHTNSEKLSENSGSKKIKTLDSENFMSSCENSVSKTIQTSCSKNFRDTNRPSCISSNFKCFNDPKLASDDTGLDQKHDQDEKIDSLSDFPVRLHTSKSVFQVSEDHYPVNTNLNIANKRIENERSNNIENLLKKCAGERNSNFTLLDQKSTRKDGSNVNEFDAKSVNECDAKPEQDQTTTTILTEQVLENLETSNDNLNGLEEKTSGKICSNEERLSIEKSENQENSQHLSELLKSEENENSCLIKSVNEINSENGHKNKEIELNQDETCLNNENSDEGDKISGKVDEKSGECDKRLEKVGTNSDEGDKTSDKVDTKFDEAKKMSKLCAEKKVSDAQLNVFNKSSNMSKENISVTQQNMSNIFSVTQPNVSNIFSVTQPTVSNTVSMTQLNVSNITSMTQSNVSNIISETQPNVSNIVSKTQPNVSNVFSVTQQNVSNITSMTHSNVSNIISETQPNVSNIVSKIQPNVSNIVSKTQPNMSNVFSVTSRNVSNIISVTQPNKSSIISVTQPNVSNITSVAQPIVSNTISETQPNVSNTFSISQRTVPNIVEKIPVEQGKNGNNIDSLPPNKSKSHFSVPSVGSLHPNKTKSHFSVPGVGSLHPNKTKLHFSVPGVGSLHPNKTNSHFSVPGVESLHLNKTNSHFSKPFVEADCVSVNDSIKRSENITQKHFERNLNLNNGPNFFEQKLSVSRAENFNSTNKGTSLDKFVSQNCAKWTSEIADLNPSYSKVVGNKCSKLSVPSESGPCKNIKLATNSNTSLSKFVSQNCAKWTSEIADLNPSYSKVVGNNSSKLSVPSESGPSKNIKLKRVRTSKLKFSSSESKNFNVANYNRQIESLSPKNLEASINPRESTSHTNILNFVVKSPTSRAYFKDSNLTTQTNSNANLRPTFSVPERLDNTLTLPPDDQKIVESTLSYNEY